MALSINQNQFILHEAYQCFLAQQSCKFSNILSVINGFSCIKLNLPIGHHMHLGEFNFIPKLEFTLSLILQKVLSSYQET